MIRTWRALCALILTSLISPYPVLAQPYALYTEPQVNAIYHMLFCDDLESFRSKYGAEAREPWRILLAAQPQRDALEKIAFNDAAESRLRILAYQRLREAGFAEQQTRTLGVVVELPMEGGQDTLAAYADGSVRYLDKAGKVAAFEGGPSQVHAVAKALVARARAIPRKSSSSTQARQPPPAAGNVRLTFLTSKGLYVQEGTIESMEADPLKARVFEKAAELLGVTVNAQIDGRRK